MQLMINISPKQAKLWIDETEYDGQRKLNALHVSFLASEMKRGNFLPTQTIAFARMKGGGTFLVNGNHTLHAIAQSGETIKLPVVYYDVECQEDLVKYYTRYDVGRSRSFSDVTSAYITLPGYKNLRQVKKHMNYFMGAVRIIMAGFSYNDRITILKKRNVNNEDLIDFSTGWTGEMLGVEEAMGETTQDIRRAITRSAVLCIALYTFKHQPSKAKEFWEAVSQDDGLRVGDPRKTLNSYLVKTIYMAGNRSKDSNDVDSGDAMMRKTAAAWNAWYEGRSLTRLYAISDFKIMGTDLI